MDDRYPPYNPEHDPPRNPYHPEMSSINLEAEHDSYGHPSAPTSPLLAPALSFSTSTTSLAPSYASSNAPRRRRTTINRRVKTVKLSPTGNFVISQKATPQARAKGGIEGEEVETLRYTAATCDPDDFISKGYTLRAGIYRRPIEIMVVVTLYNEDQEGFNRTMFALAQNMKFLCERNGLGWDAHGWEKVVVCVVADGRSKIHPNVLKVLEVMGVYQDGIAQSAVNGHETEAHIFEYTAQTVLDSKMQLWGAAQGIPPIQTIFCLKEKNAKKINSHRWFFKAFAAQLDPRVCVLIDVGTKPTPNSLYALWEAFYRNPQIGGCCGEIAADLGEGLTYFKNLANPLVASQNFEYKNSNLLDKSLESAFGYISVLPGAFSAYRWKALQDVGPGSGPMAKYFEGEHRAGVARDESIFSANLYLAEDRILCFELCAKQGANWTLHYVREAVAYTDVPDSVPEFLSQRRRWLNGSLFAGFYAIANITRVWKSEHSFLRKGAFLVQYVYNVVNQLFSWFVLGNFAVTFVALWSSLQQILADPTTADGSTTVKTRIVNVILDIAEFSYPVVLVCLFVISFGNRPQAFRRIYKAVMCGFGVIGLVMIGLLIRRLVTTIEFLRTEPGTSYSDMMTPILSSADNTTKDGGQFLINTILLQMGKVMQERLDLQLSATRKENWIYCVTLASTVGVYFIAGFLQWDFAHMFTCFVQYLILLPSYINVLTVYALSNLHDVSWGTKGDTRPIALPSVKMASEKTADGHAMAEVHISTSTTELADHYTETLTDLRSLPLEPEKEKKRPDQEDAYKSFRTAVMLLYLGTNAILFAIGVTQASGAGYVIGLLCATAGLALVKLIGVIAFLCMGVVTKVLWKAKVRKMSRQEGLMDVRVMDGEKRV
ncbi:Chitin synthase, class 1 [Thoreauomyces humboldtii]|nr:Chitin synthase, class 1 [Thoreauomyces humboldtii]